MHKVLIENALFYAFHGLHEEENKIGGEYRVDLECQTNFGEAMQSDEISKTIDYVEAYNIIKEEISLNSRLIEHLGGRIVERLKMKFDNIEKLKLKISKLNPPLKGEVENVSIVIEE